MVWREGGDFAFAGAARRCGTPATGRRAALPDGPVGGAAWWCFPRRCRRPLLVARHRLPASAGGAKAATPAAKAAEAVAALSVAADLLASANLLQAGLVTEEMFHEKKELKRLQLDTDLEARLAQIGQHASLVMASLRAEYMPKVEPEATDAAANAELEKVLATN